MEMVKFGALFLVVFLFVYVDCTFDVTKVQDGGVTSTNVHRDKRSPGPGERSEILNQEISKMSGLFDGLNSSLVNIFDSLPQNDRKSRVARDTLSNALAEDKLCEFSEEELISLKQTLIDSNTVTTKISNHQTSRYCTQLFLEIENVINAMKNNFVALKNMKDSEKINFAEQEQKSDNLIVELKLKIEQLVNKSSNNEKLKTELNRLMETKQKLELEAQELANLENERNMYMNTKINLCLTEIKANVDFKECVEFLETDWNNVTVIKYVISNAYEKNVERIAPILKLAKATPNFFTKITIFESLLDEMFNNDQLISPTILEIQYDIEWTMELESYATHSDTIKSQFENAKKKCENLHAAILNTWANEILNGRYDSIINFEFSHSGAFKIVSDKLIEISYSGSLENVGKIINFFEKRHENTCLTKMTQHLFNLMQKNNHIFTQQGMQLAGHVKSVTSHQSFSSYANDIKSVWNEMKTRFPCAIYKVFFENTDLGVKNMDHNEYLYVTSHYIAHSSGSRYVFTWRPGSLDNDCHWRFETSDSKYFTMYNIDRDKYMYIPNNDYFDDNYRRTVFARNDGSATGDWYLWELIPYGDKYFIIKNKNSGEFLFADKIYDVDRRRAFTLIASKKFAQWNIGGC